MTEQTTPETFYLDVIAANGTPFRFVLTPSARPYRRGDDPDAPMVGKVMYYDRHFTYQPEDEMYRPGAYDENGKNCGPAMYADAFDRHRPGQGLCGWHDERAWDVDGVTVGLVRTWIHLTMNAYAAAHGLRWQSQDELATQFETRALVPITAKETTP
jgi:hypothetical protein